MSIVTKFYLLQYKNWKLQFRKKAVTVFEVLIPVVLCVLLVLIRSIVEVNEHPNPTMFPPYPLDTLSADLTKGPVLGLTYTPDTPITAQIMSGVRGYLQPPLAGKKFIRMTPMDTEEKLVEFMTFSNDTKDNELSYVAGVVFDTPDAYKTAIPLNISYSIRCKYNPRTGGSGSEWQTSNVYPNLIIPGPRGGNFSNNPNYYEEGFVHIQHALHKTVIKILNPVAEVDTVSTVMERFPYPAYTDDLFLVVIQGVMPFFIMLCLIFFALNIPKEVTLEKEKKLKESMRMMGMSNWLQWTASFIKYLLFMTIITFLMSFLLCPPFKLPARFSVFANSDFSVVWLFFFMYSVATITFCFMVSVFFSKANASAAAGGIIFFLNYIPFSFVSPQYPTMSRGMKMLCSLDLNLAMPLGLVLIGGFEGTGVGVQWSNLGEPVSVDDNLAMGDILLMFAVDSLIHILIMWYVEAVFPGTYGIPKPFYFFVLPSYWCGTRQSSGQLNGSRVGVGDTKVQASKFVEDDPVGLDAGIQIRGLTKKFKAKGTTKIAVNDLNMNMYEGQITALLGHNGAGKTTTMFMLTGFLPPSSGTATVNGYDIRKDIDNVRSSLGLCPQHDILFDSLTVEEHLYFFAKLKGCPSDKTKSQIDYYLKILGIEEKRKAFSSTLSGGQKRKLSVGIALIGDSKIVILDEPTSGMDPSARRHMWDVLQEQRAGRTILLSTHFMDEADHLGDRIAILADGVVQCCGSSLFLKKKYGAGYHMVMTKKPDCDVSKIEELLTKHVPTAKLESNVGSELSYILPDDQVSAFPPMFSELEQDMDSLGILGFGASVTTMEEVFMKVGEGHQVEEEDAVVETMQGIKHSKDADNGVNNDGLSPTDVGVLSAASDVFVQGSMTGPKNTGFALFNQQFKAMFFKRVIFTWRNKTLTLSQILLPLIFTALTVIISKTSSDDAGVAVKRALNLDMFAKTESLYATGSGLADNISSVFANQFSSLNSHTVKNVNYDPRDEIISIARASMKNYTFNTLLAVDYNASLRNNLSDVTVLFNPIAYHSSATALLYADRALLQYFTNNSYTFAAANHPLPQSPNAEVNAQANGGGFIGDSFSYSVNMMFGFSFTAASFVFFLITERSRKVKHSQIVSGVKWYNFWLSTFTWDFINYLIPALLVMILFAASSVLNFSDISNGQAQPLYLFLLFLMYGLAFLPMMYALQFMFSGPATGYVVLVFFNMLTGIFPQIAVTILAGIESTKSVGKTLDWMFIVLLPNYNMAKGIGNLFTNYDNLELCFTKLPEGFNMDAGKESLDDICKEVVDNNRTMACCKDACGTSCLEYQENYLAWENLGIGRSLVFLFIQAVIFWLIVVIIDTEILLKLVYAVRPKVYIAPQVSEVQDDEDVAEEREKIMFKADQIAGEENQVVISGLTKYFGSHKAVDDIHIAIPKGECFGLLGVNGAGKTTTFKMLTGDETISGGTAFMNGMNVRTDIHQVQKSIGYCPQFDALIDQMTGDEMLYMYARLRGIPEPSIPKVVDDLMTALLLNKHRKKLTKDYSGGNKRKLSTAIALMGDPPIVFLDEPTTGMDPVARRMLWESLTKVRESGKTLILTSHSMEECEALCTRMAIMVNGKYKCLGSAQHLKNKFGAGYTLIARVSYPEDGTLPDIQCVQTFVEQSFPKSVLKDKHQNLVQYHISKGDLTWAGVFEKMEANKTALNIEDYSVSQTTLEQVFLNFARSQVAPDEVKVGCGRKFRQTCCACCIPEYVVAATHQETKL